MGKLNDLMKQAQEVQEKLSSLQLRINEVEIEVSTSDNLIHAKLNGKQQFLDFKIDATLLQGDKKELELKILSLINKGIERSHTIVNDEVSKVTKVKGEVPSSD